MRLNAAGEPYEPSSELCEACGRKVRVVWGGSWALYVQHKDKAGAPCDNSRRIVKSSFCPGDGSCGHC